MNRDMFFKYAKSSLRYMQPPHKSSARSYLLQLICNNSTRSHICFYRVKKNIRFKTIIVKYFGESETELGNTPSPSTRGSLRDQVLRVQVLGNDSGSKYSGMITSSSARSPLRVHVLGNHITCPVTRVTPLRSSELAPNIKVKKKRFKT